MKKFPIVLLFLYTGGCILAQSPIDVGQEFPDYTFITIDGDTINTKTFKEEKKVAMYNFYFENCPPCIVEMQGLNNLYRLYGDEVEFIALTFDKPAQAKAFRKKSDSRFQVVSLDGRLLRGMGVKSYPTNIVVGYDGRILYSKSGGPNNAELASKRMMENIAPIFSQQLRALKRMKKKEEKNDKT